MPFTLIDDTMLRQLQRSTFRFYCTKINAKNNISKSIDFTQLNHKTKVPQQPIEPQYPDTAGESITIDTKTIQLLERLALVDLDSKEALATLKSSIQFANKIANIDTKDVQPLYTVLEWQQLQLRNDQVSEGQCRSEVLRNAKVTDEDYFVAPPGNIPLEQQEDKSYGDPKDNKNN